MPPPSSVAELPGNHNVRQRDIGHADVHATTSNFATILQIDVTQRGSTASDAEHSRSSTRVHRRARTIDGHTVADDKLTKAKVDRSADAEVDCVSTGQRVSFFQGRPQSGVARDIFGNPVARIGIGRVPQAVYRKRRQQSPIFKSLASQRGFLSARAPRGNFTNIILPPKSN